MERIEMNEAEKILTNLQKWKELLPQVIGLKASYSENGETWDIEIKGAELKHRPEYTRNEEAKKNFYWVEFCVNSIKGNFHPGLAANHGYIFKNSDGTFVIGGSYCFSIRTYPKKN